MVSKTRPELHRVYTGAARSECLTVAAVVFAAAKTADIDDHADDEDDQVKTGNGQPGVHDPGVGESGERKKDEAYKGNQKAVIGALKIIGEKKDQEERNSGKSDKKNKDEARHKGFAPRK
jgi:hypothetical protein